MLGFTQSGIKRGFSVEPDFHWGLLGAATVFGRSFLQQPEQGGALEDDSAISSPANNTLVQLLDKGEVEGFYSQTKASSLQGLALRMMMALFGEWTSEESTTLDAIKSLQKLDTSMSEILQDDKLVQAKIEAFCDNLPNIQTSTPSSFSPSAATTNHMIPNKQNTSALNQVSLTSLVIIITIGLRQLTYLIL